MGAAVNTPLQSLGGGKTPGQKVYKE